MFSIEYALLYLRPDSTTVPLWRICPKTVSLLLKSEPIEINQKFKFLVEDIDV